MFQRFKRTVASVVVLAGVALGMVATSTVPAQAGTLISGSYTCKSGFVWREATSYDPVCVTPDVRSTAWADNAAAASRVADPVTRWCKSGYVWRETRPTDLVCVVPATRTQAASDNAAQLQRIANPAATPYGGASVSTYLHQLGGYLSGGAYHMTPNATIQFGAAIPSGVLSAGSLVTDGAGNASMRYLADLRCRSGLPGSTMVVALDRRTGVVTSAGLTNAMVHCGW